MNRLSRKIDFLVCVLLDDKLDEWLNKMNELVNNDFKILLTC